VSSPAGDRLVLRKYSRWGPAFGPHVSISSGHSPSTYERDVSSILDLQRSLATDIARRIDDFVKPLDRTRVVKPEAYGLYLKGRYAFHKYTSQGWQEAIEHFNRAIESDPEFAPAYSGLSETYLVAGAYGAVPTEEAMSYRQPSPSR
jgi:tetratricopeptide (TPR) repeat protein